MVFGARREDIGHCADHRSDTGYCDIMTEESKPAVDTDPAAEKVAEAEADAGGAF